jgi:ketosteroid isomerase-like protein
MSTSTLTNKAAIVADLYQAFGRGDINYIIDHLSDDCKWIAAGEGSLQQGGVYHGKDAKTFFQRLGENETFTAFNPVSINNINDHEVVAFGNMTAISNATGKTASSDWAMHWKFNAEGKVVYFHDFFDTAAAYLANQ